MSVCRLPECEVEFVSRCVGQRNEKVYCCEDHRDKDEGRRASRVNKRAWARRARARRLMAGITLPRAKRRWYGRYCVQCGDSFLTHLPRDFACSVECRWLARRRREEEKRVMKAYGIALDLYEALLSRPCAICGRPSEALDHCHVTGQPRAGLCESCNRGLGFFKDDPKRLLFASAYLQHHRELACAE